MTDDTLIEEFKMTELGLLPKEWEVVRLGQVLEEVDIRVRDSDITECAQSPLLSLTKEYGLIPQSERFGKRIATKDVGDYKVVERGQVVYNPYVIWEGAVHILRHFRHGLVSPVYPVMRVRATIADSYFVDQWLRMPSTISAYNRFASGAVNRRRSIRKSDFQSIEIPLPPLPEQKKIAAVLSAVQEVKEKTEAVIKATRELKKSLMKHLFTYGPVPLEEVEKVPLKETEIGLVPEGWDIKSLGDLTKSIEYGYSISIPSQEDPHGIPIVSTADISREGFITYNKVRRITPPKRLTERLILKDADVLFNWRNSPELVGKSAIFQQQSQIHTYASFLLRIRTGESLNNTYLCYLLNYYRETGLFLKLSRRAVNQANYNKNEISVLKIPFPPLKVQEKIAETIYGGDRKNQVELDRKNTLEELFKTLLSNLMTGKIGVNQLEVGA
jgi:type I restriction enzyme S subunit